MRHFIFVFALLALLATVPAHADISELKKTCAEMGFKYESTDNANCALELFKKQQDFERRQSEQAQASQEKLENIKREERKEQLMREQAYQAELTHRDQAMWSGIQQNLNNQMNYLREQQLVQQMKQRTCTSTGWGNTVTTNCW
jgi:hypothetical protein